MPEILNINAIATIVAGCPCTDDHSPLITALCNRYPETEFVLVDVTDDCSWGQVVVDQDGQVIKESLREWTDEALAAAGGDVLKVWSKYRDSDLMRAEYKGGLIDIAIPYGTDPDAFQQLQLRYGQLETVQSLYDDRPPQDRSDLIHGSCFVFGDDERKVIGPAQYTVENLENMRSFLRDLAAADRDEKYANLPEMEQRRVRVCELTGEGENSYDVPFLDLCPDWLDRMPAPVRFFVDWQESSAGEHRMCDHWWFRADTWTTQRGRKISPSFRVGPLQTEA